MQEDLARGYRNFLVGSIKTYFLGCNIIQNEIDFYTKKELKDGLLFFICAFDKMNVSLFKRIVMQDEISFKKYLTISAKQEIVLTQKGEKLKLYLETKLKNHAAMLEFNGIKPQYIGKINTMLKRFEKFWQIICIFANKQRLNVFKVEEDDAVSQKEYNLPTVINNYKNG